MSQRMQEETTTVERSCGLAREDQNGGAAQCQRNPIQVDVRVGPGRHLRHDDLVEAGRAQTRERPGRQPEHTEAAAGNLDDAIDASPEKGVAMTAMTECDELGVGVTEPCGANGGRELRSPARAQDHHATEWRALLRG